MDQLSNCSIDRFNSHYQGITKINYPKWEVGGKVWEKSTSMNPNYKLSHSYDSKNQPNFLKETTIVLKQELNKSGNHEEWHINDDSILGEDGTTNRYHIIKKNVKKSK